ncbi:MAG: GntR family transcriptional regulator [Micrococcales bacterium]|nr:GntR family transcriptional regulator [Micrococcales bacterium]
MIVSLDFDSAMPLGEQLRSQIELLIVSGRLAAGTKLPAIRHLATDLGIANGTVAKVYEILARNGLVTGSGRHGTVVLPQPQDRRASSAFQDAAQQLARLVRQLDLSPEEAHRALDSALATTN